MRAWVLAGLALSVTMTAIAQRKAPLLPPIAVRQEPMAPLSPIGKERAKRNLASLEQMAKETDVNVKLAAQNIEIIEGEMRELEALEKDHYSLIRRYEALITHAVFELKKNDRAIQELEKYLRSNPVDSEREKAQKKKIERETWRTIETQKVVKLKEWIAETKKNLPHIAFRTAHLNKERKQWQAARDVQKKALGEVEKKYVEARKLTE